MYLETEVLRIEDHHFYLLLSLIYSFYKLKWIIYIIRRLLLYCRLLLLTISFSIPFSNSSESHL